MKFDLGVTTGFAVNRFCETVNYLVLQTKI